MQPHDMMPKVAWCPLFSLFRLCGRLFCLSPSGSTELHAFLRSPSRIGLLVPSLRSCQVYSRTAALLNPSFCSQTTFKNLPRKEYLSLTCWFNRPGIHQSLYPPSIPTGLSHFIWLHRLGLYDLGQSTSSDHWSLARVAWTKGLPNSQPPQKKVEGTPHLLDMQLYIAFAKFSLCELLPGINLKQ